MKPIWCLVSSITLYLIPRALMSIVHKPAEQDGFQLLWKCTFQSLFTAAAAPQEGRQYTHIPAPGSKTCD